MIVVDTNVWSEALRPAPDPAVLRWLAGGGRDLTLTSITVGELMYGVARLPSGRRQRGLVEAVDRLVGATEVLDYDERAARQYGVLRAAREADGRPVGAEDLMIAAICRVGGHAIATRNVRDFDDLGVDIIDPWSS